MRLLARHFRRTQENTAYSLEQTFVKQGGRCIPAMNDGAFSPFFCKIKLQKRPRQSGAFGWVGANARILQDPQEVPAVGFEPTTRCREQFLRLPRIPFRHAGQRVSRST